MIDKIERLPKTELQIIKYDEITLEKINSAFMEDLQTIIYVVDAQNAFKGIITLGDYCRNFVDLNNSINDKSVCIYHEIDELYEASQIFANFNNIHNIPVLNRKRQILFEYRRVRGLKEIEKFTNDWNYIRDSKLYSLGQYIEDNKCFHIAVIYEETYKDQFEKLMEELSKLSQLQIEVLKNFNEINYQENPTAIDCIIFMNHNRFKFQKVLMEQKEKVNDLIIMFSIDMLVQQTIYFSKQVVEKFEELQKSCNEKIFCEFYMIFNEIYFVFCNNYERNIFNYFFHLLGNKVQYIEEPDTSEILKRMNNTMENEKIIVGNYLRENYSNDCKKAWKIERIFDYLISLVSTIYDEEIVKLKFLQDSKINVYLFDFSHVYENTVLLEPEQERFESEIGISVMKNNPKKYAAHISNLFKTDSYDLLRELAKEYPIISNDKIPIMLDSYGSYINIIGGKRKTEQQPTIFTNTVHIFGACYIFGSFCSDRDTIPTYIQEKLNEQSRVIGNYKVINHGMNALHFQTIMKMISVMSFVEGDYILIFDNAFPETDIIYTFSNYIKLQVEIDKENREQEIFVDARRHFNSIGNQFVVEAVFDQIIWLKTKEEEKEILCLDSNRKNKTVFEENKDLIEYLEILKQYSIKEYKNKTIGAVVMNCNPFTLGHRYLIEKALSSCDFLYIFVVEEDKSFFTFQERYRLVCKGTADFKNIQILSSGKFMISTVTFPEYFNKESYPEATIDTSTDVRLFAEYIAKQLHITVRFVGEESFDAITKQYNEAMKEILPQYGISVIEILRKEINNEVISASTVRKLLKARRWDEMKEFLPETTYSYLKEKYEKKILSF